METTGTLGLLVLLAAQSAAALHLTHAVLSAPGSPRPAAVVLVVEVLKLALNTAAYVLHSAHDRKSRHFWWLDGRAAVLALVAGVYSAQNNLAYYALARMPPALFTAMQQLRIPWTALFSVAILGRAVSPRQWAAVLVLAAGVAAVQTGGRARGPSVAGEALRGAAAMVAITLTSAAAGVRLEQTMKRPATDAGAWAQAVQLSLFGTAIALLLAPVQIGSVDVLHGFTLQTWAVACLHALGGALSSLVARRADSIQKAFATSASVVAVAAYAALHDGSRDGARVLLGALLVSAAVVLYASGAPQVRPKQS